MYTFELKPCLFQVNQNRVFLCQFTHNLATPQSSQGIPQHSLATLQASKGSKHPLVRWLTPHLTRLATLLPATQHHSKATKMVLHQVRFINHLLLTSQQWEQH